MKWFTRVVFFVIFVALAMPFFVQAQATDASADEVNAIAKKLYCPVCENIPLDACGTSACEEWRQEIRQKLERGMTEQEIIDDFVRQFGDRVVGTPQDPTLRILSLGIPIVVVILIAGVVVWFVRRFRATTQGQHILDSIETKPIHTQDWYGQLEEDVNG